MTPQVLAGLRPQAYEHPSDAHALDLLTKTTGLDTLVKKLNSWGFERLLRVQLTGSYLRVTPDSFPDLHQTLATVCQTLDLLRQPDLYTGGSELNAFTAGVEKPLIMLYSGAVEALTPEELLFVTGHEVGHIKSAHVLYYQIAEFLPVIGEILGAATFGVGELLSVGMQAALFRWKRMAEFTADRAGLLACQDAEVATRALMKLAGLPRRYYESVNTEDFMAQAREFQAMDADQMTKVAKWFSSVGADHPWTVLRAQELLKWVDSGGYEQVLQAPASVVPLLPAGVAGFCAHCGWARKEAATFCGGCGRPFAAGATR